MRFQFVAVILLAGCAMPALAQKDPVESRINKLEKEMKAVQRKVFPGGNVEPEIRGPAPAVAQAGVPAASAVTDLTARVDALEAQLATLTGQIEQSGFRVRQLEEALNRFRTDAEARFAEMDRARPTPAAAAGNGPAANAPTEQPDLAAAPTMESSGLVVAPEAAAVGDPGEAAYLAGYRMWEKKDYAAAQKALEEMAKKYPKHAKASWARNLAGRAYLEEGKPAAAAKVFLNNYQTEPKGERAADSLLYLGEALMKLGKPVEACQVYSELQEVYGSHLRDAVRQQLPKARQQAKCSS